MIYKKGTQGPGDQEKGNKLTNLKNYVGNKKG